MNRSNGASRQGRVGYIVVPIFLPVCDGGLVTSRADAHVIVKGFVRTTQITEVVKAHALREMGSRIWNEFDGHVRVDHGGGAMNKESSVKAVW